MRILAFTLALASCSPRSRDDDEPSTEVETPDTGIESCYAILDYRVEGRDDVYHRIDAIRYFVGDPETYTIELDAPGHQVVEDDFTLAWALDEPLEPLTEYTVTLRRADCSSTDTFSTSEFGLPMDDPQVVEGHSWGFDLPDEMLDVDPWQLGSLFGFYLEDSSPALSVLNATDSNLHLVGGALVNGQQDYCRPTAESQSALLEEASFFSSSLVGEVWLLSDTGRQVELHDIAIEGTFSPDGSGLEARLELTLDVRWLTDYTSSGTSFCEDIEIFDPDLCNACADGQPYCISATITPHWDLLHADVEGVACPESDQCEERPPSPEDCG